jgi:hypothetical protein
VTERRSQLDQALDLFVYAPLGLALMARDELPKLAEKGRAQLNAQLNLAKMVGQFAVTQARREIQRRLTPQEPAKAASSGTASSATAMNGTAGVAPGAGEETPLEPAGHGRTPDDGTGAGTTSVDQASDGGDAGELAIPNYDSLSASQVVQRLGGLTPKELEAVGSYEALHRHRRTILNRVKQLQEG